MRELLGIRAKLHLRTESKPVSCHPSPTRRHFCSPLSSKGKTDLILEGVLRMEAALFDMRSMVSVTIVTASMPSYTYPR